ncbi:MAG: glycosyltransferase family 2 protein, partial [Planctomycetota bacterium]
HHEEDGIADFYRVLKEELTQSCCDISHEIIFVDDGSRDGTLEQLKLIAKSDTSVSVFSLSRNQGHQTALTVGLEHADCDAVIMMDSDLQHPPSLVPQMIALWKQGNDAVLAVRQQTKDASGLKKFTSNAFYQFFNLLSDVKLTPGAADFCLLSKPILEQLLSMPEKRRFLRGMIAWLNPKTAQIPYVAPGRFAGQSSYNLSKMLK